MKHKEKDCFKIELHHKLVFLDILKEIMVAC